MCLGIPGKIVEITDDDGIIKTGKACFGGLVKEVNLSYVPDAVVGDYVIVHVGFAISKVDEEEANKIFGYLDEMYNENPGP